ncbi:unnamed protein product [Cylindrotheca closterium]|uniref:Uncharacterized protein n=1 Tax=Cylindrotheca closterium TaxID=2856 RepID=A0AAD2CT73_9STRA|nr:unnamed protein product [Cylindrotheca closterium]
MLNFTTEEVLKRIEPQEYSLALEGPVPGINLLKAWTPPPYKRIFKVDEMYQLFSKECIAMIGDSTDRRAADTLHILLSNRNNVSGIEKYLHDYQDGHIDQTRDNLVDGAIRRKKCYPGTIDNIFLPTYDDLLGYKHHKQKNYTIIVAATGPWNHIGKPKWYTPKETREYVQQVIHHLHNEIPKDILFIWKTSVWSRFGDWNELKDNETINVKGNNYLVHYANQVAKDTIRAINSTRRIVLDFSTEIAPYSFEQRAPTNMAAENDDAVRWHLGPKGRVLFAQMLAWEVARYRKTTLLSPVRMENHSQISNDMPHGSAAEELDSETRTILFFIGVFLIVLYGIKMRWSSWRSRTPR